jgi:hypothetical protein
MRRCLSLSTSLSRPYAAGRFPTTRWLATDAAAPADTQPSSDKIDVEAYRSQQGGNEEKLDIRVVDTEELFDPMSGYWEDISNWNDMDYFWKLKVERVMKELNISEAEGPHFRKNYDLSKGYFTLEWILPSPPPEHTFNELPILKEISEPSQTFEARASRLLESVIQAKSELPEHTKALESICQDFNLGERGEITLKELVSRSAKGQAPGFPDDDHDHHEEAHH